MLKVIDAAIKATAGVVSIPVAAVADAVTLGGALTDKSRPYTAEACSDFVQNVKNMTKPRTD